MNNPFLINGSLIPNVSINKLYIAYIPPHIINENLEGKYAGDIFSTQLIINEIKEKALQLNLNLSNIQEKKLPQYLEKSLYSNDEHIRKCAESITKIFGERLAIILLTLKMGVSENITKRKDWTKDNWIYWRNIQNVILVVGLSSGKIGEQFKEHIEKVFKLANVKQYNIILNEKCDEIAIRGSSSYINNKDKTKEYLIMDCGATFIKRSYISFKNDCELNVENLEKVLSKYVEWEYETLEEEKEEALKLHGHILKVIKDSLSYYNNKIRVGNEIIISIANYINNGVVENRGGYGKLRLLNDNYETFLSDCILKDLNIRFQIKLVHDGTAMAANFKNYSNSVCVSLGTCFGVGFP